jgi:hypothetical protein
MMALRVASVAAEPEPMTFATSDARDISALAAGFLTGLSSTAGCSWLAGACTISVTQTETASECGAFCCNAQGPSCGSFYWAWDTHRCTMFVEARAHAYWHPTCTKTQCTAGECANHMCLNGHGIYQSGKATHGPLSSCAAFTGCTLSNCKNWDCKEWCKCFDQAAEDGGLYAAAGCSEDGDSCKC